MRNTYENLLSKDEFEDLELENFDIDSEEDLILIDDDALAEALNQGDFDEFEIA